MAQGSIKNWKKHFDVSLTLRKRSGSTPSSTVKVYTVGPCKLSRCFHRGQRPRCSNLTQTNGNRRLAKSPLSASHMKHSPCFDCVIRHKNHGRSKVTRFGTKSISPAQHSVQPGHPDAAPPKILLILFCCHQNKQRKTN